jgi:hypothetical protein
MKTLQEQYEVFDIELTEEEAKKIFKKEYVKIAKNRLRQERLFE